LNTKLKRRYASLVFPLGLALVLGACSSSSNKEAAAPSVAASASVSPSPSASPAPSASPKAAAATSAAPSPSASASSSGKVPAASPVPGYVNFGDPENKISLQYPKDWTLRTDVPGVAMAALSPLEGKTDTFQENVTLVIEDLKGQAIDLKQYMDISKQNLAKIVTNFKLQDEDTLTDEGHYVTGLLDYTGAQGQSSLFWRQAIVINNGKAYTITYTATVADPHKYVDQFANIADTFRIN